MPGTSSSLHPTISSIGPAFGSGLGVPRFGAEGQEPDLLRTPMLRAPSTAPQDTLDVAPKTDDESVQGQKAPDAPSKSDKPGQPSRQDALNEPAPPEPVRDKKYWLKSAILSAFSLAALVGMILAALPSVGFIAGAGLFLAGLLMFDFTTDLARQKGLTNISDPDYLKKKVIERAERPLAMVARLLHPSNPEKQAAFVDKYLGQVHKVDPHALLGKTGMNYQQAISDIKSQTSFFAKAFVAARFLMTLVLQKGLWKFVKGRGKIAFWIGTSLFAWLTGNKYGRLDDPQVNPVNSSLQTVQTALGQSFPSAGSASRLKPMGA